MKSWGKIVTFGTIFLVYAGFMLYRLVRDILDEGLTGPNDRVNLKRHRDDIHADNRRRTDHLPSWPTTTYISPSSWGTILTSLSLAAFPHAPRHSRLGSGSAGSAAGSPKEKGCPLPSPMPSPTWPGAAGSPAAR